jgi:hypothetical protein
MAADHEIRQNSGLPRSWSSPCDYPPGCLAVHFSTGFIVGVVRDFFGFLTCELVFPYQTKTCTVEDTGSIVSNVALQTTLHVGGLDQTT